MRIKKETTTIKIVFKKIGKTAITPNRNNTLLKIIPTKSIILSMIDTIKFTIKLNIELKALKNSNILMPLYPIKSNTKYSNHYKKRKRNNTVKTAGII